MAEHVAQSQTWSLANLAQTVGEEVGWSPDEMITLIDRLSSQIAHGISQGQEVIIDDFAKIRARGTTGAAFSVPDLGPAAQALGKDPAAIAAASKAYFALLSQRLIANDKLKIERFLALKVSAEKPRIIDDPISGQKLIAPAKKVISFMPHPLFKQQTGGADIEFIPARSLKEGVETIKTATVLLAIPQKDFFTETLQFHFERAGWRVHVSPTTDEALTAIESGATYLVLIDASLPGYLDLCERIKTAPATSLIPVILMLPTGADPLRATEFRVMGNEALAQPFEIKKLLTMAEAELERSAEDQVIFSQEVSFQFPTTDECIDRANEMAAKLFQNSGLDEEGQVALCAAFREGCGNAAQHGNRHRRDKNIDVMYLLDTERITVIVTDEGNGFDWRLYVDDAEGRNAVEKARKRHKQGKLGGLGIMLMLKCTDRLEYNESGNVVTLTKYLAGHGPTA